MRGCSRRRAVRADARGEIFKQRRISFNQNMIETVFGPGEIVRYYNHTVHRVGETGEIASKWKLKNRKYEVVSREGTIYVLRDQDTGATSDRRNVFGGGFCAKIPEVLAPK